MSATISCSPAHLPHEEEEEEEEEGVQQYRTPAIFGRAIATVGRHNIKITMTYMIRTIEKFLFRLYIYIISTVFTEN